MLWFVFPTSSSLETVATAFARFLLRTLVPSPVMTTSSRSVSSVFIIIDIWSPVAATTMVSNPMKEKVKISPVFASIEKFPSKSDVVPLSLPSTTIVTPGIGFDSSSWTVPEICCEKV